jgi:N-acetylglucosamine-6-phosphate deacetylase
MDRAVRNVTQFSNWSLQDAVRAATLNPAQAVGLAANRGILAPGSAADFNVLSKTGEVLKTIVHGQGF